MSNENEITEETPDAQVGGDVGQGVTNEPRGTGDRDEDAIRAGEDRLEQAGGGH